MNKANIRLKLRGLSYSQLKSGAYALILEQPGTPLRIPVVIGAPEAQSIAMTIEEITPPRPMTHDLFASFTQAFGIRLERVDIYKFEDGIFYSELTFSDGERTVEIDSRTSDAIAIAIRAKAPIFTTQEVIDQTAFKLDEEDLKAEEAARQNQNPDEQLGENELGEEADTDYDPERGRHQPKPENMTVSQLQKELQRYIDAELYEDAARIQAIINKKTAGNESQEPDISGFNI